MKHPSKFAAAYLDPRWQKKRLEIMQRDGFKCRDCESAEDTLNVHHDYYVKGRMPWQYPSFSLTTLCRDCHRDRHDQEPIESECDSGLFGWEIMLDWFAVKDPCGLDDGWYAAGEAYQLLISGEISREQFWKSVESHIARLRGKESPTQ